VTRDVMQRVRVSHVNYDLTNLNVCKWEKTMKLPLKQRPGAHSDTKQQRTHHIHYFLAMETPSSPQKREEMEQESVSPPNSKQC